MFKILEGIAISRSSMVSATVSNILYSSYQIYRENINNIENIGTDIIGSILYWVPQNLIQYSQYISLSVGIQSLVENYLCLLPLQLHIKE